MSKFSLAVLLAIYTCLGWGMIAPMAVKMIQHLGGERFHPALPFLWNTFGNLVFALILILFTGGAPLRVWTWHWSGWVIFFSWSTASLSIAYALSLAQDRASIPNAVAAIYPALVSAPILWYFLGETMSFQKVIGLLLAVFGVVIALLA